MPTRPRLVRAPTVQSPEKTWQSDRLTVSVPRKHRRSYRTTRSEVRTIALERIEILLRLAKEVTATDQGLARKYVELARKISTRTKVRIPSAEKRFLCKNCGLPLIPGRNARVRTTKGNPRVVITCLSCGAVKRYPFGSKPV